MERLSFVCPGDCSSCELLQSGKVEMVPCLLDQIFQSQRKKDAALTEIINRLDAFESTLTDLLEKPQSSLASLSDTVSDESFTQAEVDEIQAREQLKPKK